MGDRANVKITEADEAPLYIYTHWSGTELPELLRSALAAGKGRWGDAPYLNRILIREIFADLTGLTGGGVSTYVGDGDDRVIEVTHDMTTGGYVGLEGQPPKFTFQQYVDLPQGSWEAFGA